MKSKCKTKAIRRIARLAMVMMAIALSFTACGGDDGWEAEYAVGDTGPGGGKIFYVSKPGFTMIDDNTTCHYLEAAPADMATTLKWASSDYTSTDITGTGGSIGRGRENTALILATDADAPAAKACDEYSNNGKTDWFLPSSDELNELRKQKNAVGNFNTTDLGYTDYNYLSSTQDTYSYAYGQDFTRDGGDEWCGLSKSWGYSVRAVRAF
jgi:hypothetical protein